ncbi:MAG: ribbon-helix-helix protein, CopG family [Chloroflexi bacterium]|nr:ribbon-helix-helix protein, CopG family [Chloroflexota bacterium]
MAPIISRNTETVTFSLPPAQAQRLRQAAKEEERTVSELLREAIRLYMEEREWRAKERMKRRSRQANTDETEAG